LPPHTSPHSILTTCSFQFNLLDLFSLKSLNVTAVRNEDYAPYRRERDDVRRRRTGASGGYLEVEAHKIVPGLKVEKVTF
jgi:hypothetical protein